MAPKFKSNLKPSRKEKRKQDRKNTKQKRFISQQRSDIGRVGNKKTTFGIKTIKKSGFREKKIKAVNSLKKLSRNEHTKKEDFGIPGLDEVMEIADQILTDKSHKEFIDAKREEVLNRPKMAETDRKKKKFSIFGETNAKNTADKKFVPKFKLESLGLPTEEEGNKVVLKKIRTFFNKLCSSNIEAIALDTKNLFDDHSQHEIIESLIKTIKSTLYSEAEIPEALIINMSALVATLDVVEKDRFVGIKILIALVAEFEANFSKNSIETRKFSIFIAFLYNLGIAHEKMARDVLYLFVENMTDFGLELFPPFFEAVVYKMRRGDKEFVNSLLKGFRAKCDEINIKEKSKFSQFQCERILDFEKILHTLTEKSEINKHRKVIGKIVNKNSTEPTTQRTYHISLKDFLSEKNTLGYWWIDKSAENNNNAEIEKNKENNQKNIDLNSILAEISTESKNQLLAVSDEICLFGPLKKNIFLVIHSAEKASKSASNLLKIIETPPISTDTNTMEKCVAQTLFHCFLSQKGVKNDKLYFLIFCDIFKKRKSFQFTLQLVFWDFLKDLEDDNKFSNPQIKNITRLLSHLISSKNFTLKPLSRINWITPSKSCEYFVISFFAALFTNCNGDSLKIAFDKFSENSQSPKLANLGEFMRNAIEKYKNSIFAEFDGDETIFNNKIGISFDAMEC